jgi:hypothetical protein
MAGKRANMQGRTEARPSAVVLLIWLQLLLALGALAGGGSFVLAPDGHIIQMPLSNLKDSPFKDFLIPGILLFTLVGLFPLAVAHSLWKRPNWRWPDAINPFRDTHWSWAGSLAAGAIIILWITVQVLLIRAVAFLHVLYWVWGVVLLVLTLLPSVRRYFGVGPLHAGPQS